MASFTIWRIFPSLVGAATEFTLVDGIVLSDSVAITKN